MAPTTSRNNQETTANRTGVIHPSLTVGRGAPWCSRPFSVTPRAARVQPPPFLTAVPYRFEYFSLFDNKKRLDDLRNITGGASPSPTALCVIFALRNESKHLCNFSDITAGVHRTPLRVERTIQTIRRGELRSPVTTKNHRAPHGYNIPLPRRRPLPF